MTALRKIAQATALHSQKEIRADHEPECPVLGAFRQRPMDKQGIPSHTGGAVVTNEALKMSEDKQWRLLKSTQQCNTARPSTQWFQTLSHLTQTCLFPRQG